LTLAGGPFRTGAQSPDLPVIGFLNIGSARAFSSFLSAFHRGLNTDGYFEGRNVTIDYRWAEGDYDLLNRQAAELARNKVTLIVATGGVVVARAARTATDTIPILFVGGFDPIAAGLVASIGRPEGNATGVNLYASDLLQKRLEIFRELVPTSSKFAALINPKTLSAAQERADLEVMAQKAGLKLTILEAGTEGELQGAFETAAATGIEALIVSNDGFFTSRRQRIIEMAQGRRLPVAYGSSEYVLSGGLISYGPNIADAYRKIGGYAVRILKGAKPADLPVQLPTKFDLAINLKSAKSLGIDVPYPLLITATEVFE
jgi:putative ABC transport system substrate-binding protein